ncbi:hypothetical protein L2E82_42337 [Cichorium intybus]|uniref:Uncharacterized protein n=1 Tax=Cichorium intybus TaxID=13427 RepID=A0ACB8ZMT3_CICIN|nr:hypothetical protein L2E82_42337 [Cichorium intybus]
MLCNIFGKLYSKFMAITLQSDLCTSLATTMAPFSIITRSIPSSLDPETLNYQTRIKQKHVVMFIFNFVNSK